jgi:uncharacterized membrane protein
MTVDTQPRPSVPVAGAANAAAPAARLASVDTLRGLVMILMALDHVRDFYSPTLFPPEDLARTWPALFLTRWITHFCAPVFVFLAGTGAFLARAAGRPRIASYLARRGCFLIALELVVLNPLWMGSAWRNGMFLFLQVIWAIGWSMILLSLVVRLPAGLIGAIGLLMVCGHNLLDGRVIPPGTTDLSAGQVMWAVLHGEVAWAPLAGPLGVYIRYPLIPWPGVMMCGYAFGALLLRWRRGRAASPAIIGLWMILGFLLLRASNFYGDPRPWVTQERGCHFTLLSFLNCEKYPPSLCFLLMTLGPAIALLPALERRPRGLWRMVNLFGRVPLFFYLLHVVLIHGSAVLVALAGGRQIGWWWGFPGLWPAGYAADLRLTYAIWPVVLLALYPACAWYAGLKQRRSWRWLKYL